MKRKEDKRTGIRSIHCMLGGYSLVKAIFVILLMEMEEMGGYEQRRPCGNGISKTDRSVKF